MSWARSLAPLASRHRDLLLALLVILVASYHITVRSEDPMSAARDQTRDFFAGESGSPVQYRVLSQYVLLGVAQLLRIDLASYSLVPYVVLRFIQAVALLWLAYAYYGRLGIQPRTRILGLAIITGIVSVSLGERGPSTMSLDRVTDTILYLVGGLIVTAGWVLALPVLMVVAILNRETSGMLPMVLIARYGTRILSAVARPALIACLAAWGVWAVGFFGLRAFYGPREWYEPGFGAMFLYSLGHDASGAWFFAMASVIPLLAALSLRIADPFLRRLFWLIVPVWVFIHFGQARYYEGLLYLAPMALILIPLALQGIERLARPQQSPQIGVGTDASGPLSPPRPEHAPVASPLPRPAG